MKKKEFIKLTNEWKKLLNRGVLNESPLALGDKFLTSSYRGLKLKFKDAVSWDNLTTKPVNLSIAGSTRASLPVSMYFSCIEHVLASSSMLRHAITCFSMR